MAIKITRTIPARTYTIECTSFKRDYSVMGPIWRRVRAGSSNPMTSCGLCGHKFADGETMGLGMFATGKNRTLCGKCCDELEANRC